MRKIFEWNTGWRFLRDDTALTDRYRGEWSAYITNREGHRCPIARTDYPDGGWQDVILPHDWMVDEPFSPAYLGAGGYKRRGAGWYRRRFTPDAQYEGKRVLLIFEGVMSACEVYVNGALVMRNTSGYQEFTADIGDYLVYGQENVVAVHADAREVEGWWYEGAGIYRPVHLEVSDHTRLAHNGIFLRPRQLAGGAWQVEALVEAENTDGAAQNLTAHVLLTAPDGAVVGEKAADFTVPADGSGAAKLIFPVENPVLWDLDAPELYTARCELFCNGESLDWERVHFGIRALEADKNGLRLNGKPLAVRGTCIHQDHAGVGVALPPEVAEYRIRLLKEAGFNAYRAAHHPPSRAILEACDRLGMLVLDENRHFNLSPDAQNQVRTMARRDRNHPSVAFYSLFNEEWIAGTAQGVHIYRRLARILRREDDSRLLTGAMSGDTMLTPENTGMEMDITGINYSLPNFAKFRALHPEQPLMGVENVAAFGTRGCMVTEKAKGRIAEDDTVVEPWFNSVRETVDTFAALPYVAGYFLWSGFDYRGEPCPSGWPAVSSQFGILDTCGFPKGGYHIYQACIRPEPVLTLLPHWDFTPGETVTVTAVTNCERVALYVNGNLAETKAAENRLVRFTLAFVPGTLRAVGIRNEECVVTAALETPDKAAYIEMLPAFAKNGVRIANICLKDAKGRILPRADAKIGFSCTGGRILGCGNGDPTSLEMDHDPARRLFAGYCQVLLDDVTPGAVLIACAEGLPEARFRLD